METENLQISMLEADSPQEGKPMAIVQGESKTLAEEFLEQHYAFRKNVLKDIVEYKKIDVPDSQWVPLTQEALNSIFLKSKHELGEDVDVKADIKMYVESEEPMLYDPINNYLDNLPVWDGKDRVVDFWKRIPGVTAEQIYYLSIYSRYLVAQWKGLSEEHGNECVPVLIGNQDTEKSTFCIRMLPPQLRCYYLDHFNLANKFDKEMALSNCLLICLDEFDQYKPGQMAELKQALSKVKVTSRKIYGRTIGQKSRYASFIATTNNRHPLQDPTGSRRYLCIDVQGVIDNSEEIEYDQFFAQIVHELNSGARYWFTHEELLAIQQMNAPFEQTLDLEQMIGCCYRKPQDGEIVKDVTSTEISQMLKSQFPSVSQKSLSPTLIGRTLKDMGIDKKRHNSGYAYSLVEK